MYKGLFAAAAVAMLLGCGSDKSTGPVNPNPKNYNIIVNGSGFTPGSQSVVVYDTVTFVVSDTATGRHQISFYNLPPGVSQNPTNVLSASQSGFVVFIKAGTYSFKDDSTNHTGTLTVNPVP